jgi:transcription elongation factor GreA
LAESNLVELALSDLEALERAWAASLQGPTDIGACCHTLRVLCERDMASRALPMACTMVEALQGSDRLPEAFQVGMTLVRLEAHNEGLVRQLVQILDRRYLSEPWYPLIARLASLTEQEASAEALETFDRMRRYTKGHVVYHRAGWGAGVVEDFDAGREEISIRFGNGRVQEIPLTTAFDSMTPLAEDDLRSMLLIAKDELTRLSEEAPSILIRKAATVYRGTVSTAELKGMLCPDVVPTKKWTSFWKKAKAAAAADPYLQVEGSTTRPVFVLRKKPLSLADEARRTLRHCDNLGEEIAQIREYLERSGDPEVQATILQIASERIEAAAREGKASHAHLLDGILLLEQHGRHPATSAASELQAMLVGGGEFRPENFDLLGTQDAREHAVGLLPEALGESWARLCIEKLTHFPISVVESLVQLLCEKGHGAELIALWDQVAPYPQRYPLLTYLLGKQVVDGTFRGVDAAPTELTVTRVLLHLSRVLASSRKRDAALARLLGRVASLLTGRRGFLARVLQDVDRDSLATFLGICERGGADFPQEISDLVLRAVAARFPELTAKPERPFWEDDSIYTTRGGLAAKREEYRRLVEELIPANSRAIGAAASLGDLSENSEWEAAMEEQRNLTTRASMIDEELRRARLLEEIEVPSDVGAPGTAITYSVPATGERRTIKLLGPWDATTEDVINYMAPFAKPLLGKTVGDTTTLLSEGHEQEVRIESIERIV